jgi:hypothetical protein
MKTDNPWDLVEKVARSSRWEEDNDLLAKIHPACDKDLERISIERGSEKAL